ncbi:hypothetical protein ABZ312_37055 [Streptomyces sp. NPDC006207]
MADVGRQQIGRVALYVVERLAGVGVAERVDRRVLCSGGREDLRVALENGLGGLADSRGGSRSAGPGIDFEQDSESEGQSGGN